MRSPLYWHPVLYETGMRLVYGRGWRLRYRDVARFINEGESVVDVCAGDCALYRYELKAEGVDYLACDINQTFITWAKARGIQTKPLDLRTEVPPSGDCLVMMGSLCQFIPNEQEIFAKLIASAKRRVIVCEPVRNWSTSSSPFLRMLGRFGSRLDDGEAPLRFDERSFQEATKMAGFQIIETTALGREMIAVFEK